MCTACHCHSMTATWPEYALQRLLLLLLHFWPCRCHNLDVIVVILFHARDKIWRKHNDAGHEMPWAPAYCQIYCTHGLNICHRWIWGCCLCSMPWEVQNRHRESSFTLWFCCGRWRKEYTSYVYMCVLAILRHNIPISNLSIDLSTYLPNYLPTYLSIHPSIYPSTYISIHPSIIYLSIHPSIYLST